jgi:hypothetical protein
VIEVAGAGSFRGGAGGGCKVSGRFVSRKEEGGEGGGGGGDWVVGMTGCFVGCSCVERERERRGGQEGDIRSWECRIEDGSSNNRRGVCAGMATRSDIPLRVLLTKRPRCRCYLHRALAE